MSTTVWYNGVELRECETKVFSEEVFYDESNTDRMYYLFRIRVASTMVYGPEGFGSHGFGESRHIDGHRTREFGHDLGNKLRAIQRNLSAPRRDFYYVMETVKDVGGPEPAPCIVRATGELRDKMLDLPASIHNRIGTTAGEVWRERFLDANNGPRPVHVEVSEIFGGNSVRVEFEIEVALVERFGEQDVEEMAYPRSVQPNKIEPAPSKPVGADADTFGSTFRAVLSNRWSVREVRNADWAIERTFSGVLRIKHQEYLAHSMRYLCMPGLENGYQRRLISFTDDPTGLNLRYEIVDVQREAAPPPPAVEWSGTHSMTTTDTAQSIIAISMKLTGPPGVKKQEMFLSAIQIIKQRVPGMLRMEQEKDAEDKPFPVKVTLESSALVNVISEPTIEIRAIFRAPIEDNKVYGLAFKQMLSKPEPWSEEVVVSPPGTTPPDLETREIYHPDKWPAPLPFATVADASLIQLFSCYLQNPSTPWHGIPKNAPPTHAYSTQNPRNHREDKSEPDTKYTYTREEAVLDATKHRSIIISDQLDEKSISFVFIKNTYRRSTGIVALQRAKIPDPLPNPLPDPPPEPEDTVAFAQLSAGICYRDFYMEVTRIGDVPFIPEPTEKLKDPNGITERLLTCSQELAAPEPMKDAVTRQYKVVCEYTYALSRTPTLKEKLRMATSPIDKLLPEETLFDQEKAYSRTRKIEWREPLPPS